MEAAKYYMRPVHGGRPSTPLLSQPEPRLRHTAMNLSRRPAHLRACSNGSTPTAEENLPRSLPPFFPRCRRNCSFVLCNAISTPAYGRATPPCPDRGLNDSAQVSFREEP